MASAATPQPGGSIKRSTSGSRRPLSRPTTPLRPSSRSSLRESGKGSLGGASATPLDALEPAFAEFSDSMADLEANFMHLQLMHESLARFSENFASFLYGLNMNAFCVDFPEVRSMERGGVHCVASAVYI
jgi:DASH complex subunit DAM1